MLSTEILEKRENRTPESHAVEVAEAIRVAVIEKYKIGQKEHGGRLWEKPVRKFAPEEVIDMWVYLHTLQEQQELAIALIEEAINSEDGFVQDKIKQALNVLKTGNVAGQQLSD